MNNPNSQPVYWELRNGPDGETTKSGFADSIKEALLDIAVNKVVNIKQETFVIPSGLYIDGSPQSSRTYINTTSTIEE